MLQLNLRAMKILTGSFLLLIWLSLVSCRKDPPNVILVMADDMGAECLSTYGGTSYRTPNLDQMAQDGLVVDHCISQPLCTPSRVKLMTGLCNARNYTHFGHLDTKWLNIGTLMKEAGYRTCISGKWQLNGLSYKELYSDWDDPSRPNQMGFDSYCLWQLTHPRSEGERYSGPLIEQNGKLLKTGPDDYGPDIFCDFVLDFIEQNRADPFFIYYPMVLVHAPFVPTPGSEAWIDPEDRYRRDTAFFPDMMTYTDKIIGKIRNKLEEEGIADNTLLIFTADNGTSTAIVSRTKIRRVRGGKGNTITDGVHVPLLINWPGKTEPGKHYKGLIEFSDFFATLAELVKRDVKTDGHSFLPLLEGKHYRERKTVMVYYDPMWGRNANRHRNIFVQTRSHKLYQDGTFFNLDADILEKHPIDSTEMTQTEAGIRTALQDELGNVPGRLPVTADVIVYGGTSAAVSAAVQTARMGRSVVLVSPDIHLGGMTASGLGWTDSGNKAVIGGLARNFYHRLYLHYQEEESWRWQDKSDYGNTGQGSPAIDGAQRTMWIFEPGVAERTFEEMITENGIPVFRNEWLDRQNGVQLENGAIRTITTLSGKRFRGKVFIDATYEGDLMASAGVSYHVGREGNDLYGEKWNGVQTGVLHHGHHFKTDISPYIVPGDPSSGVLPRISTGDPGKYGKGDHRVQAYCFRMCLTRVPENRVEITRPSDYDSTQYELLVRVFASGWREVFRKFDPIPNGKTDVNNHGPFSFDNIGMNYDYPEAGYKRRKEIIAEHTSYQKGLLWFLKSDPRVPAEVRNEMATWGYAADEFTDNGHWPHQIYVREARRMVSGFVMTEHEVLGDAPVDQPVGMGSYTMDSHNVQRYIKPDGFVQNEGDIGVHPENPYQIDLRSILPRKEECRNLLVPVCLSSSHIAFGSIRMEPVFMILGQSAATLAAMALETGKAIHAVPYEQLKKRLLEDGQVLEYQRTH